MALLCKKMREEMSSPHPDAGSVQVLAKAVGSVKKVGGRAARVDIPSHY